MVAEIAIVSVVSFILILLGLILGFFLLKVQGE
uniref:Cytochrome b6-f complex subunit 7 n=1 Tax=Hydropuntia rangiferina TaxID=338881 RepID=A0A345U8G0_9FLOR|nr:cytochrome b6-f complex subunit 7 [Hydropuntia rangiferina]AXI96746.1 cytochrome b6-f complex subunit 7 [Hydropuntia rangiferina]UAD87429.1 cytochrome b6-f complex subunit 7 [Hydropuntia rangiferina]